MESEGHKEIRHQDLQRLDDERDTEREYNTLTIKLMSLAVHAEEFIETGEPFDRQAIEGLLTDPEVTTVRAEMAEMALLPVKR